MSQRSREAEPAVRRKRAAAGDRSGVVLGLDQVADPVLSELIRRVRDIEATYRAAAQMMGQLYMYADRHELCLLTRDLDRPMRNASDNERAMVSILDELQLNANLRQPGGN